MGETDLRLKMKDAKNMNIGWFFAPLHTYKAFVPAPCCTSKDREVLFAFPGWLAEWSKSWPISRKRAFPDRHHTYSAHTALSLARRTQSEPEVMKDGEPEKRTRCHTVRFLLADRGDRGENLLPQTTPELARHLPMLWSRNRSPSPPSPCSFHQESMSPPVLPLYRPRLNRQRMKPLVWCVLFSGLAPRRQKGWNPIHTKPGIHSMYFLKRVRESFTENDTWRML